MNQDRFNLSMLNIKNDVIIIDNEDISIFKRIER